MHALRRRAHCNACVMLDVTCDTARLARTLVAWGLAATAATCTTPVSVLPPGPLARELNQEALHATGPEGVRVESHRFVDALADYEGALQGLTLDGAPLGDLHGGLFRRLADAIAAVPGGELVGTRAAAASIHLDAIVLADRRALGKPRVAAHALATAAAALLALARGPYRASPDVLNRARDLRATSTLVTAGEPTPELVARGLRAAELTLMAIQAAVP